MVAPACAAKVSQAFHGSVSSLNLSAWCIAHYHNSAKMAMTALTQSSARQVELLKCDSNSAPWFWSTCETNRKKAHTHKSKEMCSDWCEHKEKQTEEKINKTVLCGLCVQPAVIPCKALPLLSCTWQLPLLVLYLLLAVPPWHKTITIHMPQAKMGKDWVGKKLQVVFFKLFEILLFLVMEHFTTTACTHTVYPFIKSIKF